MPRTPLPARPPRGNALLTLLNGVCESLLSLDGTNRSTTREVIDAVMLAKTTTKTPFASSAYATAYADRVGTWVHEHRDSLIGSLTGAVLRHDAASAIRLATRLLLLAPHDMDPVWLNQAVGLATQIAEDQRHYNEAAVLHELAARCHIAQGRLADAELCYLDEQNALFRLEESDRRRRALVALSWRRVRLHWTRGDLELTLRHLDGIAGHLDLGHGPAQASRLLRQIAYAEVLYQKGQWHQVVRLLANAVDSYADHHTVVERIDAGITVGHALCRGESLEAAQRHWVRVLRSLSGELAPDSTAQRDQHTLDKLAQRHLHLKTLIAATAGPPPRLERFSVLGPCGTSTTPRTDTAS